MVNHTNTFYTVSDNPQDSMRLMTAFFLGEECPNNCPEKGRNENGYACECVTFNELDETDFEECDCDVCR